MFRSSNFLHRGKRRFVVFSLMAIVLVGVAALSVTSLQNKPAKAEYAYAASCESYGQYPNVALRCHITGTDGTKGFDGNPLERGFNSQEIGALRAYGDGDGGAYTYDTQQYAYFNPDVARDAGGDGSTATHTVAQIIDQTKRLNRHFLDHGINEDRATSTNFDVRVYKYINDDLRGMTNGQLHSHFHLYGSNEHRVASLCDTVAFNATYYREHNSDLATAYGNSYTDLCAHFIAYGINEGRQASASFNVNVYRQNNPDLAGLDNFTLALHFTKYGRNEGRKAV